MAIGRVWSNGVVSMPLDTNKNPTLTAAQMGSLDTNFQRALDKSPAGGSVNAVHTLAPGAMVSVDAANTITITGAAAQLRTSNGGLIYCNDNDYPLVSPPRSRSVVVNLLELAQSDSLGSRYQWTTDANGRLSPTTSQGSMFVPLDRVHDGAVLSSVTVEWTVDVGRGANPAFFPFMNVWRVDPLLGTRTMLRTVQSSVFFPSPGAWPAYWNAGNANVMTFTCDANNVIDVSKYFYWAEVVDDSDAVPFNKWHFLRMNFTAIPDLRFG